MPGDHSKLAPLLPIPNRTVKRLCADDSADSRVKVGHRQALTATNPLTSNEAGGFVFGVWDTSILAENLLIASVYSNLLKNKSALRALLLRFSHQSLRTESG